MARHDDEQTPLLRPDASKDLCRSEKCGSFLLMNNLEGDSSPLMSSPSSIRVSRFGRALVFSLVLAAVLATSGVLLRFSVETDDQTEYLGLGLHNAHHVIHVLFQRKAHEILKDLERRLEGSVLHRQDAAAHVSASVWNRLVDYQTPPVAAVILAETAADVSASVPVLHRLEKDYGVSFRILSGGHSYVGYSGLLPDGIILSVEALNEFSIRLPGSEAADDDAAVVTLGAAVPAWDLLQKGLVPHGYGGVVGCSPNVTMGGYTLGGGIGRMARLHGLAVDQVRSFDVVLADGRQVTASDSQHADLFWALRGAGQSSYGVVTALTYELHPMQDELLMATGSVPVKEVGAFLSALAVAEQDIPGEVFCEVGNDESDWYVTFYWFGLGEESLAEGEAYFKEKLLPQLLPADEATAFDIHHKSWQELTLEDSADDGFLVDNWNGFVMADRAFTEHFDDVVDRLWEFSRTNCEYLVVQYELWGGAVRKVAPRDTAFYWRDATYSFSVLVMVPEDIQGAERIFHRCARAMNKVWDRSIAKYTTGSYVNYPTASLSHDPRSASFIWGKNVNRLSKIKQIYDPENVFHQPQSVPLPP